MSNQLCKRGLREERRTDHAGPPHRTLEVRMPFAFDESRAFLSCDEPAAERSARRSAYEYPAWAHILQAAMLHNDHIRGSLARHGRSNQPTIRHSVAPPGR